MTQRCAQRRDRPPQAVTLEVDDLEQDMSPEDLMLSFVSAERGKVLLLRTLLLPCALADTCNPSKTVFGMVICQACLPWCACMKPSMSVATQPAKPVVRTQTCMASTQHVIPRLIWGLAKS